MRLQKLDIDYTRFTLSKQESLVFGFGTPRGNTLNIHNLFIHCANKAS